MLYEKLNHEMRETVDQYVHRLAPLSWQRRTNVLAEASDSFAEEFDMGSAELAARGFVTAVLERLNAGEIEDPHQAYLFSLSLIPAHQILAEEYLSENPELRELIDREVRRAQLVH